MAVAVHGRLVINHWFGIPTRDHVRRLEAIQLDVCEELNGGRQLVCSAFQASVGVRLPDDVRQEAVELSRRMNGKTLALGQVVLGKGFFASILRSTLTGVTMASRPHYPQRVFSTFPTCGSWLARELEATIVGASGEEVTRVLRVYAEQLRQRP